jgi:hypothetical protein
MEQAHSNRPGALLERRDAAPVLRDSRSIYPPRVSRSRDARPATWLNLVCLDAPVVAVTWLCLFAKAFGVPVSLGNATALFLTAWLIYLADRLVDAFSLKEGTPRSLRQEFCLRHREVWIGALVAIGGFDAFVIWRNTAAVTFFAGTVVGILALIYLVLNQPLGLIWRSLPAKEIAIGFLFAAGTLVALLPKIPSPPGLVFAALGFAGLCSLNCISIACWERELDRAQRKVSIATRHPGVARVAGKACLTLALAGVVLAIFLRVAAPVFACISVSALLLRWLDGSGSLAVDQRTALADLVLLTPIVALILAAL